MKSYRRRRRMKRQRNNKTARNVLIVVFCVLLCIILTVMFGNYLKDKAAASRPDDGDTTISPDTTQGSKKDPPDTGDKLSVEAGYLDLFVDPGEDKNAEQTADEFFATSYAAASFMLRDEKGSLLYTSDVASALGQKSASALDMKELVSILSERDIYTIGCFASAAFTEGTSREMYDVILSYETALIRELFELGIDEILLMSIPLEADNMGASLGYITAIKSALPKGSRLGVAISHGSLTDDGISVIAKEVSQAADFIALDMRGFEYDDIYTAADLFIKENVLYISRYNMRMLLPLCEPPQLMRWLDALGANAVYNWQIIK